MEDQPLGGPRVGCPAGISSLNSDDQTENVSPLIFIY